MSATAQDSRAQPPTGGPPLEPTRAKAYVARRGLHVLKHFARHTAARVESRERDVELSESSTEGQGKELAERAKTRTPFRPGVEIVGGRARVEVRDALVHLHGVEVHAAKLLHIAKQSTHAGAAH